MFDIVLSTSEAQQLYKILCTLMRSQWTA